VLTKFLKIKYILCSGCSYLSRFDLVNWKVLVEYPFASELDQKVHIPFDLFMSYCIVSSVSYFVNPDSGYSPDAE
jgi:hypothetical protein